MHILVINVFFAPNTYGGATIVAEEVAKSLVADHGHRVSAISAISRPDLQPYAVLKCAAGDIEHYQINLPQGRSAAALYQNADVSARILRIAEQIDPDLVHIHCVQDIGADCISALKAGGFPVVLSVHDFWWICERQFMIRPNGRYCGQSPVRTSACRGCVDDFAATRARNQMLKKLGEEADLITYPSEFAKTLSEASGFGVGQGAVLENGVRQPSAHFFEHQALRRAKDDRLVFGFVGGPSRIKGWPLLHRAFAGLGRDDFKGWLVEGSRDGSWWRSVDFSAMKGSWSVHPRFEQASIDDFYAKIDVLLFMSQWKETFGLTIREALSRGIQVIQTDSGGTTEHGAKDGVTLLPMDGRVEPLRRAIQKTLAQGQRELTPHPVASYADQANAFLELATPLLKKPHAVRSVA